MAQYRVRKADIGTSLGLFDRCPFVAFDTKVVPPPDLLKGLTGPRLKGGGWIPIRCDADTITVAMKDPHDLPQMDGIERLFAGRKVKVAVALAEDIAKLIDASFGADTRSLLGDWADLKVEDEAEAAEPAGAEVSDNDSMVIRLANQIVMDAHRDGASDIHIEPQRPSATIVRFRIDGDVREYQELPSARASRSSRASRSWRKLDISERRKPQDGKITLASVEGARDRAARRDHPHASNGNEDVVHAHPGRLQAAAARQDGPERRATSTSSRRSSASRTASSSCVGPTGSGKTTTLHSALGHINTADTKIWTAEDPVEITQPGLRQVQVQPEDRLHLRRGHARVPARRSGRHHGRRDARPGDGRRSASRRRSPATSCCSTLHTNSAPETITRLLDMGLDPFSFADALLGVLAQRLARALCTECGEPYDAVARRVAELIRAYGEEELAAARRTADGRCRSTAAKGCESCKHTGSAAAWRSTSCWSPRTRSRA